MALTILLMAFPGSNPPTDVTPVDAFANSAIGYWLAGGTPAIVAFVLFWLYVWPGKLARKIRDEARADLAAENQRLREALTHAEHQRDEAMGIANEKLLPLLSNFVAITGGMVPVLQQVVALQPLLLQLLNRRDP